MVKANAPEHNILKMILLQSSVLLHPAYAWLLLKLLKNRPWPICTVCMILTGYLCNQMTISFPGQE